MDELTNDVNFFNIIKVRIHLNLAISALHNKGRNLDLDSHAKHMKLAAESYKLCIAGNEIKFSRLCIRIAEAELGYVDFGQDDVEKIDGADKYLNQVYLKKMLATDDYKMCAHYYLLRAHTLAGRASAMPLSELTKKHNVVLPSDEAFAKSIQLRKKALKYLRKIIKLYEMHKSTKEVATLYPLALATSCRLCRLIGEWEKCEIYGKRFLDLPQDVRRSRDGSQAAELEVDVLKSMCYWASQMALTEVLKNHPPPQAMIQAYKRCDCEVFVCCIFCEAWK